MCLLYPMPILTITDCNLYLVYVHNLFLFLLSTFSYFLILNDNVLTCLCRRSRSFIPDCCSNLTKPFCDACTSMQSNTRILLRSPPTPLYKENEKLIPMPDSLVLNVIIAYDRSHRYITVYQKTWKWIILEVLYSLATRFVDHVETGIFNRDALSIVR